MIRLLALAILLFAFPAQAVVNIDWVTVGGAGNPADDTGYGAVSDPYRISKFEISDSQYAEFLNAIAATDTFQLYKANMDSSLWPFLGGITRSGSSGSYTYSVITNYEDKPVGLVAYWDAVRFANWLHNGQPTGAQDNATTEDGAYTITPSGIANNNISRNVGATVFIPSEDEWYKAAYYDPNAMLYYNYPAGSDAATTCDAPTATANRANCFHFVSTNIVDVGGYTGSASPNGTFDQGGNVWEWNETATGLAFHGIRGGRTRLDPLSLAASERSDASNLGGDGTIGFRIAAIDPGAQAIPFLNPLGIGLLCSLLGLAGFRRPQRG